MDRRVSGLPSDAILRRRSGGMFIYEHVLEIFNDGRSEVQTVSVLHKRLDEACLRLEYSGGHLFKPKLALELRAHCVRNRHARLLQEATQELLPCQAVIAHEERALPLDVAIHVANVVVDAVAVNLVPAALGAQEHTRGVAAHADRLEAHHHVRARLEVALAALLGVCLQRTAGNVANGQWDSALCDGHDHLILLLLAFLRRLKPIRHHRLVQRDVSITEVRDVGGALRNVGKGADGLRPVLHVAFLPRVPVHLDV